MIYREIEVPEAVQGAVQCAWQFLLEPHDPPALEHQVPPDGTTNFVLVRAPDGSRFARLVGPRLAAFSVPVMQGFRYAGLRLRPEAAQAVTGAAPQPGTMPALEVDGPFSALWDDLQALHEGSCSWTGALSLFCGLCGDEAITGAVDAMIASGGRTTIARLAADAGLSERQFRRRFHAATSVTPKQYADVQRVRAALIRSLADGDWAGIAHDSGFADQPHLTRDVTQRFGAPPRRVAGYLGRIRHELLPQAGVRFLQYPDVQAA
jgi:AraC-like DNA-binding protein